MRSARGTLAFRRHGVPAMLLGLAAALLAACSDAPGPVAPKVDESTPAPASAALLAFRTPPFAGCQTGTQSSGALYEICLPDPWNGDVVYWAHGYKAPNTPLAISDDEVGGVPISQIVTSLGYGFATTSYRRNGLAADVAVADLEDLARIVKRDGLGRGLQLLAGASEGGLSTALALEQAKTRFDGGLATCGPVGSFRRQIDWVGDFRAVFDYYFPGVLPGDAVSTPQAVRDGWPAYVNAITDALAADPFATTQLLNVTGAPIDPSDPTTVGETVVGLLWYSVFASDDAVARLGGNPYDNRLRWYHGSTDDFQLNRGIERHAASPTALAALSAFETTGHLRRPIQMLHTTGDPIVPYWHEPLYAIKVLLAGSGSELVSLPVSRYGHCTFTENEALASFALLVLRVSGQNLLASANAFPTPAARREFLDLAAEKGARPTIVEQRVIDKAVESRRAP